MSAARRLTPSEFKCRRLIAVLTEWRQLPEFYGQTSLTDAASSCGDLQFIHEVYSEFMASALYDVESSSVTTKAKSELFSDLMHDAGGDCIPAPERILRALPMAPDAHP